MNMRFPNGDKIATLIFRAIIFCLGVLLLVVFIKYIWNKAGIKGWIVFFALISLFMGYGIGGDIWGARFFDFFTGQNSQRQVEKNVNGLSKAMLFILLVILFALLGLFIFSLYLRHRT